MASASSNDSTMDGYTLNKSDITFDMAQKLPTYWPALIESIKSSPIIDIKEEEMVGVEKKDKMTVEKRKELDEKRKELVEKVKPFRTSQLLANMTIMLIHKLASRAENPHEIRTVILKKLN